MARTPGEDRIVSLGDVTVSSAARRRIRSFSTWVWVAGALLMAIVAFNTYARLGLGEGGFALIGDGENPWQQADPTVFDEHDGDVWSGTGSGVIHIPLDEHKQEAYTARLESGEYVDLFVTRAEDIGRPADDRGWPDSIAYFYDVGEEALVLPPDGELELWVRADGDWEVTLEKAEVDEVENGLADGKGNAFLVYRGDAVSARFVHKGDGPFYVTIHTFGGESDQPIIESGDVSQRLSWDPTEAVYFTIESDAEHGAWLVDIDELATDAPEPPTPEPTSTPAAQPATPASRTTASRRTRGTPSA